MSDIFTHEDPAPTTPSEIEMETRNVLDSSDNIIGQLSFPYGTDESIWQSGMDYYAATQQSPTIDEVIYAKLKGAAEFGINLMDKFAIENVLMGITEAGKTAAVIDYFHKLEHYIRTGSLYAAMDKIDELITTGVPQDLDPFVTQSRLESYKAEIERYLA